MGGALQEGVHRGAGDLPQTAGIPSQRNPSPLQPLAEEGEDIRPQRAFRGLESPLGGSVPRPASHTLLITCPHSCAGPSAAPEATGSGTPGSSAAGRRDSRGKESSFSQAPQPRRARCSEGPRQATGYFILPVGLSNLWRQRPRRCVWKHRAHILRLEPLEGESHGTSHEPVSIRSGGRQSGTGGPHRVPVPPTAGPPPAPSPRPCP